MHVQGEIKYNVHVPQKLKGSMSQQEWSEKSPLCSKASRNEQRPKFYSLDLPVLMTSPSEQNILSRHCLLTERAL